jgi:hypothetical protein
MVKNIKIIPTDTSFVRKKKGKFIGHGRVLVNTKILKWDLDEIRNDYEIEPLRMRLYQGYSIWNNSGLTPENELEVKKFILQEVKKGNIKKDDSFGGVF